MIWNYKMIVHFKYLVSIINHGFEKFVLEHINIYVNKRKILLVRHLIKLICSEHITRLINRKLMIGLKLMYFMIAPLDDFF